MIVVLTHFEVGPSMALPTLFDWLAIAVAELVCTGTSGEGIGSNGGCIHSSWMLSLLVRAVGLTLPA